jgi:ribosomal protein L37AE/L43A
VRYTCPRISGKKRMPTEDPKSRTELTIESILEGKKMEAYVEHRTKEMHSCTMCGAIGYKRKPMKQIGNVWFCIDCMRHLKEVLDTLSQWEAEIQLEREMSKKIDETLGM